MSDMIGKSFGQYEIKSLLGQGGMALVYRARQLSMNRDVAIKVMSSTVSTDPDFVRRFEQEAQLFAELQHPHILPVIDFGNADGHLYIVMRLVEGGSLDARIREGAMSLPLVAKMITQIGSALTFAHTRGIVHRDLKPSNVLLDSNDNAYLTDFGIAKMLAGSASAKLTASNTVLGTPSYMAPEQWRGEHIDARTDTYSMGIMLYEMVTGRLPFAGDTSFTLMYKHFNEQPPRPREYIAHLSDDVENVILKAMAKDPDDRFQSAEELGEAFRAAVEGRPLPAAVTTPHPYPTTEKTFIDTTEDKTVIQPVTGQTAGYVEAPTTIGDMPFPQQRRNGLLLLGLLGVVALVIAGAFFVLSGGDDTKEAAKDTNTPTSTATDTETHTPEASNTPLPIETLAATVTPRTAEIQVMTQRSVVREGPGENYAEVAVLQRGDEAQVIAATTDGDWYRVLVSGELGWIAAETVSVSGNEGAIEIVEKPTFTPTPSETPSPTSTYTPTFTPTVTDTPSITPTFTPTPIDATQIALNTEGTEGLSPFTQSSAAIAFLIPDDWDNPLQTGSVTYITPNNTDGTQIMVVRGSSDLLGSSLAMAEVNREDIRATLTSIGTAFGGENFDIVELDDFRTPAYHLHSQPFDNFVTDVYIWDLEPEIAGRDWLVYYSIYFDVENYETFQQNILIPMVYSFNVDGEPLAEGGLSGEAVVVAASDYVLSVGEPQQDTLSQGEEREWTFSAEAGQSLIVRMDALDENVDPLLSIKNAAGAKVAEDDDSGGGTNALIRFEVPTSGDYTIVAGFFGPTEQGRYSLLVDNFVSRRVDGGVLVPDRVVQGIINDEAPEIAYSFAGTQGSRVTITLSSLFGDLDTYLVLLDPNGQVLAENDDNNNDTVSLFYSSDSALVGVALPLDGTYTVLAQRYDGEVGTSAGEYEIQLQMEGGSDDTMIISGMPVTGTITDAVAEGIYTFEAQAGSHVTITMSRMSGDLDAYLILLNPDGIAMAENDDYTDGQLQLPNITDAALVDVELPADGVYVIRAQRYDHISGGTEGDYELSLELANNP